MKLNAPVKTAPIKTHEGGASIRQNATQQLRRSIMACLLWEDSFYENGQKIAERIASLVPAVPAEQVAAMAVEAREQMKLRHIPLFLVSAMAGIPTHKALVAETLARVIQRADELSEFLAIHQQLNPGKTLKKTISAKIKRGLAAAFSKFDAYALAKYNRDSAIKLRDALLLCHAKPKDEAQAALWKQLIDGTIATPDTWEVELSASKDKKASWERLLNESKLGGLALLRNLRNMAQAGIDRNLIRSSLSAMKTERILPFRFIAAARYAPEMEPELETAMFRSLEGSAKLTGRTILMVDVSGSMDANLHAKSDLNRIDAACGLAMLLREVGECDVFTFSNAAVRVPARRGFALRDAIKNSQPHGGTYLGAAVTTIQNEPHDRLIVVTDEQSADAVPAPLKKGYMVNVASYENGVGYGPWTRVTGWSESIVRYIQESERTETH